MNEIKSNTPEKRGEVAFRIVIGAAIVCAAIAAAAMIGPKFPDCLGE